MMGNLFAESALSPINLQNTYEKKLGYSDSAYTIAVDNGTYTNFIKDSAGYGLAQWTFWSRKQNLLNYAKSKGVSIGDLNMQLEFLMQELNAGYKSLLNTLKTTNSVSEASSYLRKQMVNRKNNITIRISSRFYNDMPKDVFDKAVSVQEGNTSSEGDYLANNLKGYNCSVEYSLYSNGYGNINCGKIAESYGGGGHVKAAGFKSKKFIFGQVSI